MTTKHQEIAERLSREFEIGDRHIQRIEEALNRLSSVLPLSLETYMDLDEEQVRCIDPIHFPLFQTSRCDGSQTISLYFGIFG